jgi:phosphohistidine phosphatase
MRRLILLRHAKSDWASLGASDHARSLAPRGREAAPRIGAYMAHHALVPNLVICSTAARARQTWDLVAAKMSDRIPVTFEPRIYEAAADDILDVIKQTANQVHVLLLVGHNPGLRDLAEMLIASGDVEARQRLLNKLPTAGLAAIDFPLDDWRKLHPKAGRLDRFVAPRTLETATD